MKYYSLYSHNDHRHFKNQQFSSLFNIIRLLRSNTFKIINFSVVKISKKYFWTFGSIPIFSNAGGTLIGGGTMISAKDLPNPRDQMLIQRMDRKSGPDFGRANRMVRFLYWPRLWSVPRSSGMKNPSTSLGMRPAVPTMKCVSSWKKTKFGFLSFVYWLD